MRFAICDLPYVIVLEIPRQEQPATDEMANGTWHMTVPFMPILTQLVWPVHRIGELTEQLGRSAGLPVRDAEIPVLPQELDLAQAGTLGRYVEEIADWLGLEAEAVETPYSEVESFLSGAGPALLSLSFLPEPGFLAVIRGRGQRLTMLTPDLKQVSVPREMIREALSLPFEPRYVDEVNELLNQAGVPKRKQAQARRTILRERLSGVRIGHCWLLRLSPGASVWRLFLAAGMHRQAAQLLVLYAVQYGLFIWSWAVLGRGALAGRIEIGWLVAWALLLLTLIPFRLWLGRTQGRFAIQAGAIMKQKMLYGALRMDPQSIRAQGAGQLLSRVSEAQALESGVLNGAIVSALALLELLLAGLLLAGSGIGYLAILFWLWTLGASFLSWRYFVMRRQWTDERIELTHDLVERMVAHRTRLAQELPEYWHSGEDQAIEQYHNFSARFDRFGRIQALAAGGWTIVGMVGLFPLFLSGASQTALAVGLGGIILSQRALGKVLASIANLTGVLLAWKNVSVFFTAATRTDYPKVFTLTTAHEVTARVPRQATRSPQSSVLGPEAASPALSALVEGHDLFFRYREQGEPIVRGVSLCIYAGDRLLLEGPSGGGKSTFASLLTGIRVPQSGLILVNGLDRYTLGPNGWRKFVTAAPQFHENHVLTNTFSFNLLMGRRWPASHEDNRLAEEICRELGLDEVLSRMPAGMLQMVGETGWQLSHGERSRLFIARALLQGAELMVLDESFAALDPETLRKALECVLRRANAVLVIAHP
ncbi:MAG: ABC transporter ATP-binding protein/permease [Blastocatellia bacterium]|nr:ABC transporter ATP-binding protein/permease [Blastocatellia bacterium]